MFTLVTENNRYFRVRRGLEKAEVEAALLCPVSGETFSGRIIERGAPCFIYSAKPGDSYRTLAEKFGLAEEELKTFNFGRTVYPTCRVFVPRKSR